MQFKHVVSVTCVHLISFINDNIYKTVHYIINPRGMELHGRPRLR